MKNGKGGQLLMLALIFALLGATPVEARKKGFLAGVTVCADMPPYFADVAQKWAYKQGAFLVGTGDSPACNKYPRLEFKFGPTGTLGSINESQPGYYANGEQIAVNAFAVVLVNGEDRELAKTVGVGIAGDVTNADQFQRHNKNAAEAAARTRALRELKKGPKSWHFGAEKMLADAFAPSSPEVDARERARRNEVSIQEAAALSARQNAANAKDEANAAVGSQKALQEAIKKAAKAEKERLKAEKKK